MAPAENFSENYAEILQSVAKYLPPFLQDGGEPPVPLVAWFAAYNAILFLHQVFQGGQVMDWQKNWLLLDRLGEQGRRRLGQHMDVMHMEAAIMPHAAFLQDVRQCLQDPASYSNAMDPSTGSGKPRCTGVIYI